MCSDDALASQAAAGGLQGRMIRLDALQRWFRCRYFARLYVALVIGDQVPLGPSISSDMLLAVRPAGAKL